MPDKGKKSKKDVECWGCGKKGHFRHQCRNPKKTDSKKGESKTDEPKREQSKSDGRANAAESDSESEGAWFMEDNDEFKVEDEGLSDLHQLSDSGSEDDDSVDFSQQSDDEDWFFNSPTNKVEQENVRLDSDSDEDVFDTIEELGDTVTSGDALVASDVSHPLHRTELYDSGCTNHISPFRNQFENFIEIPPKRF